MIRVGRRFVFFASAGVCAAALLSSCSSGPKSEGPAAAEVKGVEAPVAVASRQGSRLTVDAPGVVRAQFSATLSAKVVGRVATVAVREGDSVRKGQVLVTLDAQDLSAAVDVARANAAAASASLQKAQTAASMEVGLSAARVKQAEALLAQAQANQANAKARYDLALAGPRRQERTQAELAVADAEAQLKLAKSELARMTRLFDQGAVAKRDVEFAQSAFDSANARYSVAVQGMNMAQEGTRAEDLRAAQEALRQADAAVRQARAGLAEAQAAAMQVKLRRDDAQSAKAQVAQSEAAARMASVNRSFATIVAPFDGRVVARMADPGSLASPGVPLLVVEGGPLRLEATVPETLLAYCSVGTRMDVAVEAADPGTLSGTVVEVVPKADDATHSFVVKVELPAEAKAKAGMFGRALVPTKTVQALLIPAKAVWEREGLNFVFAVNDQNIALLRLVTIGRRLGDQVEILSGLDEGERYVANGRETATDGVRVSDSGARR